MEIFGTNCWMPWQEHLFDEESFEIAARELYGENVNLDTLTDDELGEIYGHLFEEE